MFIQWSKNKNNNDNPKYDLQKLLYINELCVKCALILPIVMVWKIKIMNLRPIDCMCILLTKQKSYISRKTRQVINQRPLNLEVKTRALTFIPTCLITNMKFFVSYIFVLNDKGIAQVQSICIFGNFIFSWLFLFPFQS